MAGSLNRVTLIGNLGADPEIRSFANGGRVAHLRLATSESWKDRNSGERRERTEWHRVAIYAEPTVAYCERWLRKGMKVFVEGQLETRKWQDRDGRDQYTTEIAIRPYRGEIINLSSRADGGAEGGQRPNGHHPGYNGGRNNGGGPPFDDEIPF